MSKNNSIGAPKTGERPTREQLQELLLRVLDGMIEEKEPHGSDFESHETPKGTN